MKCEDEYIETILRRLAGNSVIAHPHSVKNYRVAIIVPYRTAYFTIDMFEHSCVVTFRKIMMEMCYNESSEESVAARLVRV